MGAVRSPLRSPPRTQLALAGALAALLACSCEAPLRALTVDVQTDLVPAIELGVLEIELFEGSVPRGTDAVRARRTLVVPAPGEGGEYRAAKRVAELAGLAPGTYTVRVVGRRPAGPGQPEDAGTVLGERRLLVMLERNRVVRVVLASSCVGVTCPGATDGDTQTQCLNGRCVSPRCDPSAPDPGSACCSGPGCGEGSLCADASGCEVAPCAAPACVEGVCIAEDRPGACVEGEYCDRSARACLPVPGAVLADAGMPDGGALDAAVLEPDAYRDPGTDAGHEDAFRCPSESCGNGIDDDCDGAADCMDADCTGTRCDDGDACTHSDACTGTGCAGTPITCSSTECVDRACNGGASCTETPRAGTCADDGNVCTADLCSGGACVHPSRADGTVCFGAARCCGGACINVTNDPSHCGICGLGCPSGTCVESQCRCASNAECRDAGYGAAATCYDAGDGFGMRCQCVCNPDSAWRGTCDECPGAGMCDQRSGLNLCFYP